MATLFAFLSMLVLSSASIATPCPSPSLAIHEVGDEVITCCTEWNIGAQAQLLVKFLPSSCIYGITQLSFRLEGYPEDPGYPTAIMSLEWYADEVIGNLHDGITLRWDEPVFGTQSGDLLVGAIDILVFDPSWPGTDVYVDIVDVAAGAQDNCLEEVEELWNLVINPSWSGEDCCWVSIDPPPGYYPTERILWIDEVSPPDDSHVFGTLDLVFEAATLSCMGSPMDFECQVFINDETVFSSEGSGIESISASIPIDDYPLGTLFDVRIELLSWEYESTVELQYLVSDDSPVRNLDWSTAKALY